MRTIRFLLIPLLVSFVACVANAQVWKSARWEKSLKQQYNFERDVRYGDAPLNLLDVYAPNNATESRPVLIWYHGGGWGRLSKDSVSGQLIPYLQSGWVVVNVDYRLAPRDLAPAAVVDCRCALAWVLTNADRYGIDTSRIVLSGTSAGGHLALITGMLPDDTALDRDCHDRPMPSVAAIINFYGITDVNDLLEGKQNRKGYAVRWLGDQAGRDEVARHVSPLSHVTQQSPPIFTAHGDADPTVPYEHAVRLHRALEEAGVPNELFTVPGGLHGKFTKEENLSILHAISGFLNRQGIGTLNLGATQ